MDIETNNGNCEQAEEISQNEMEEAIQNIKLGVVCQSYNVDFEIIKYLGEQGIQKVKTEEEQVTYIDNI